MRATGRRPNRQRETPLLDAWLEALLREIDVPGGRSELARYLAGTDERPVVARWLKALGKYFRRESIPSGEVVLQVEAWRRSRPAQ